MFTSQDRDQVRQQLLQRADADERIVAGAEVGAGAWDEADRWSDLDLTFGVADTASISDVLADWTGDLDHNLEAIHLFDLPFLSTIYRVFLFPGNLQVDLSFSPASDFGALGPKFNLLFGEAVDRPHASPDSADEIFGLAVHHAVRGRICIERGRLWQAEYWISPLRDHALSLACLRQGFEVSHGRGFDRLPPEVLRFFRDGLIRSLDRGELLRVLRTGVEGLLRESEVIPEAAARAKPQLRELITHETL